MKIDNHLLAISKVMFTNRDNWKWVTPEQKEEFFFIFNRYFSKKYPQKAQLLNDKGIDKVMAMDIWFSFIENEPYPKWFWSKSNTNKIAKDLKPEENRYLLMNYDLKQEELDLIIRFHNEEFTEEIKYIRNANK